MWSATAEVEEYTDAVEWFKDRFPVTEDLLAKLGDWAGARAWTIAGVTQLDIVLQVHDSIVTAIRNGTSLDDWKKSIGERLTEAWGKKDSWRTELVFRNATQQAYVAGRMRQLRDPATLKIRPYWMFDGIRDSRQSPICRECDKTILPADHAWWNTHTPQLHHACRSRIEALRAKVAQEKGITQDPPGAKADVGFGKPPDEDKPFRPDPARYPKELFKQFEKKNTPQEGVHFQKLTSNASKKAQGAALDVLSEKGLLPFLEKNPLSELVLNRTLKRGANGSYWQNSKKLAVRIERIGYSYGQGFTPGKSWSVSSMATTNDDAVKRTLVHELGHHIHLTGDQAVDDVIRKAFTSKDRNALTEYARANHQEYFAESFAAYKFHRYELETHDPVGFRMVEEVLRLRGVQL